MAYGVKYSGSFYDRDNNLCLVEILKDGYAGVVNNLVFGDTPVVLKLDEQNKPIYEPIKTTSLEINLIKTYFTQYEEFLNSDDKSYLVNLYVATNLIFSGWLITSGIQEPYRSVPYILSLQAVDGINRLKDVTFVIPSNMFTRPANTEYFYRAWRVSIKDIMSQIMAALPPVYTIRNYSNLVAYDLFSYNPILGENNYLHFDLVKDKSLFDCLDILIKSTGHKITIENTIVKIYSLKEVEKWTANEAIPYIDYDTTYTPTGTGTELISKQTIGVDFELLPNGVTTKNAALKSVEVKSDFGLLDNLFIPGDLNKSVSVENGIAIIYNWSKVDIDGNPTNDFTVTVKEDEGGRFFVLKSVGIIAANMYLKATMRFKDIYPAIDNKNSRFEISFESRSIADSDIFPVGIKIINPDPSTTDLRFINRVDGEYIWDTTSGDLTDVYLIENEKTENWTKKIFKLDGSNIPLYDNGDLEIYLFCNSLNTKETHYRNIQIRLYHENSDGSTVYLQPSETVEVVNNAQGLFKKENFEIKIATMPESYNGMTVYNAVHACKAGMFVERTPGDVYYLGRVYNTEFITLGEPLQDYIGKMIAATASISQKVVNCDLLGSLNSWLTPIFNIEEPNMIYLIGSGSFDIKRKRGKFELLQFVPYVGDDWDRILTEDSYLVLAENDDELLTEKNIL